MGSITSAVERMAENDEYFKRTGKVTFSKRYICEMLGVSLRELNDDIKRDEAALKCLAESISKVDSLYNGLIEGSGDERD